MAPAREFATEHIRNVAVVGHASSGKTTLVDALCFATGTSSRKGNVDEGHALTLTTPEEIAHRVSMRLTPAYSEWMDCKINLLDTPGYLDFTADALSAVRVADAAVVVVSATSGVEVGTEKVWEYCEARGIPRIVFVSMMDQERADFDGVFQEVKSRLSPQALPIEIPIGSGDRFRGLINLFRERAHFYGAADGKGEFEVGDIPDDLRGNFEGWRTELQETLATQDESLLEQYLEGGGISREEAISAMARGMARGEVFPVLLGSPRKGFGVRALLRRIVQLLPNPSEARSEVAASSNGSGDFALRARDEDPFSALVFKTVSEPHVGNLTLFRVFSGAIETGAQVLNASRNAPEKLNHLGVPLGKERPEVRRLHAGDIGVVGKLRDTQTNDSLADARRPLTISGVAFPRPEITLALRGVTRADDDRLGEVLPLLRAEDPSFHFEYNAELHQTIVRGLGELHLEMQIERMARKYGVRAEAERPRIAYRETIRGTGEAQGRYKKQTGGRGQFGDCWIRLTPRPPGSGFEFVDAIKGGAIPGKYLPSVERGIVEAAAKGVVAGYPVVDFRAECYDGSFHSVDSSDIAFQVAGSLAFQRAAKAAGPHLLEPVMELSVTTPDSFVGDVLSDITQRRGKVLGMDAESGRSIVRALVPQAELYKYAAALRAMTQGRAHHARKLIGYEPVPEGVAKRLIEEDPAGTSGSR